MSKIAGSGSTSQMHRSADIQIHTIMSWIRNTVCDIQNIFLSLAVCIIYMFLILYIASSGGPQIFGGYVLRPNSFFLNLYFIYTVTVTTNYVQIIESREVEKEPFQLRNQLFGLKSRLFS